MDPVNYYYSNLLNVTLKINETGNIINRKIETKVKSSSSVD